ncbi:AraC family transcriptional regulator [Variovorax sp. Sphag1AA]|uniref:AraC family transcriptional regulator n=1 Tax=Variovorax sp. Sphag1AA TaxID=2587027 RepID=UPI00161B9D41|nr:AraC family transcriptional regulator [Variovorax sp. Sphag1AA]MBB3182069.1 AraC-like DNA-binding protein [Variovorax sp. Sphag1AA]
MKPLYENCIFRSAERARAFDFLGEELVDHSMKWGRGLADTALFKGKLKHLELFVLRYGAEVTVDSDTFDGFALVHMSLRGGTGIEVDGRDLHVAEGRAAVIAPRKRLRLHCLQGAERMVVKVPYELLGPAPERGEGDIPVGSGFMVSRSLTPQWVALSQALLGMLAAPSDAVFSSAWVEHFERSSALFLSSHQPDPSYAWMSAENVREDTTRVASEPLALSHGAQCMERALEYMQSRMFAPISLSDLARAASVSERTLNVLCRRFHGVAPMTLLRNLRLDAVRSRLLLQPDANVTQTALEYGFAHPGRFAACYRERFDELPHQTLSRATR